MFPTKEDNNASCHNKTATVCDLCSYFPIVCHPLSPVVAGRQSSTSLFRSSLASPSCYNTPAFIDKRTVKSWKQAPLGLTDMSAQNFHGANCLLRKTLRAFLLGQIM